MAGSVEEDVLHAFQPGNRNNGAGTLYNVGQNGYSWSSSVPPAGELSNRAYYLNFNNTGVNPQNTTNRANGLQVRCLQAFIGVSRSLFCGPLI